MTVASISHSRLSPLRLRGEILLIRIQVKFLLLTQKVKIFTRTRMSKYLRRRNFWTPLLKLPRKRSLKNRLTSVQEVSYCILHSVMKNSSTEQIW